jgi:hypothetical protein
MDDIGFAQAAEKDMPESERKIINGSATHEKRLWAVL